ncbi:MAG TPA: GTP cyclohydrolase I FolE [Burkholderiales bacterium]|jgi:GTP cyclohydrolase I|nr:GTP cyclohydrolase I FolE [Burkholderiales bacterium]
MSKPPNETAMTLTRQMLEENEMDGYAKIDQYNPVTIRRIAEKYRSILEDIGEDPGREGLQKTPERIAKALQFLTHGYDLDPAGILRAAMFREEYQQMVIVKDIELYSLCEHHLLPFFGKAHVAYIPNGHIVGLSKIPRVVDAFARRLQVQERLTVDIRNCIHETLQPLGVAVVIEAQHLCMIMRGIQKQHSIATTSAFTGEFNAEKTRAEFMRLITRATN